MTEDRFVTFTSGQGIEHTYRIVDIDAVGVDEHGDRSYIRAHHIDFALTVPKEEAIRVREIWMREG